MKKETDGFTQIGEILNSHGVRGEVKVALLTEDCDLLHPDQKVTLMGEATRQECSIIRARPAKNYWLIQFAEIVDMDTAKKLKGSGIFVDESELKPLADDECFIHDLLDAKVYSTDNQYLGVITNYFEAGTQGICEVTLDAETFLFPVSQEVLKEVIPPDQVIINLLPGLRELNRKT